MSSKAKKTVIMAFAALACVGTCLARPHHGGGFGRCGVGPRPAMHHGGFHRGGFHGGGYHGGYRPHGGYYHGGYYRGGCYRGGYYGPGYYGGWGRGGRYFWPGFVGGIVGGALYDAVVSPTVVSPSPVVVSTPTVYASTTVWVEGRYVDQVQADGTIIRVWQPGHYEQR